MHFRRRLHIASDFRQLYDCHMSSTCSYLSSRGQASHPDNRWLRHWQTCILVRIHWRITHHRSLSTERLTWGRVHFHSDRKFHCCPRTRTLGTTMGRGRHHWSSHEHHSDKNNRHSATLGYRRPTPSLHDSQLDHLLESWGPLHLHVPAHCRPLLAAIRLDFFRDDADDHRTILR